MKDVSVINKFNFDSDHRLIRAKVVLNHKTNDHHNTLIKKDVPKNLPIEIKERYKEELKRNLNMQNLMSLNSLQDKYDMLEKGILDAANNTIMQKIPIKTDKLSTGTKCLIKKREEIRQKQL